MLASSSRNCLLRVVAKKGVLVDVWWLRCVSDKAATVWECRGTNLRLAGKVSQIKRSMEEVPSSILVSELWTITNHTLVHASTRRTWRSVVFST